MASCFKFIVCSGDHKHDFAAAAACNEESMTLSDKQLWSFRRKSSSQRVIIHTASANSLSSDRDIVDLGNQQITSQDAKLMHLNNEEASLSVKLSAVTLIQTAARRFLAQRKLMKLKKLVKLQAVIRGQLVRRHAVRSLHCLHALAKMQALARARMSSDKSFLVEERPQDTCDTVEQPKVDADSTPKINTSHCYSFHDMLLSNSFARQLLKSTQNPKHFNIEFNPLSPCPVWLWMERWMSLASLVMETKHDAGVEWHAPKDLKLSSSVKNSPRTPSSQLVNKTKNRKHFKSKDSLSSSVRNDSSAGESEPLHQKVNSKINSRGTETSESDSGSITKPSYMKATVSAKARLHANNSPRLNHDVLQEDMSITRRHSLPVSSLKQISPKHRQASDKSGTHS